MITDIAKKIHLPLSYESAMYVYMKLCKMGGNCNIVSSRLAGWGCRLSASNWNWQPC